MGISTFQKLTVVSCVVLCVALLLPKALLSRGQREPPPAGPPGHFPPMLQRASASEEKSHSGRQFSRAHNPEAIARAKGATTGGKSNLAGQIIPIYGFGILLYILYILFKITSRGKTTTSPESRFSAVRSENMKRKITDFELDQLQDRLNETKDVIESIISAASVCSHSMGGAVAGDEEQRLLYQLKEITRVMQEGRLIEDVQPNTEDPSCGHEWNGAVHTSLSLITQLLYSCLFYDKHLILTDFEEDSKNEVNQHFCGVHSPDVSSDTCEQDTSSETGLPEHSDEMCVETVESDDDITDASRNRQIEDITVCDAISQLKPETHETPKGSDMTHSSVSDNSIIRRRKNK